MLRDNDHCITGYPKTTDMENLHVVARIALLDFRRVATSKMVEDYIPPFYGHHCLKLSKNFLFTMQALKKSHQWLHHCKCVHMTQDMMFKKNIKMHTGIFQCLPTGETED